MTEAQQFQPRASEAEKQSAPANYVTFRPKIAAQVFIHDTSEQAYIRNVSRVQEMYLRHFFLTLSHHYLTINLVLPAISTLEKIYRYIYI